MEKEHELQLAGVQQLIQNGNLKNPKEVFDFLDGLNYFTSKEATEGFVDYVEATFSIPHDTVLACTRMMVVNKVKVMDKNGKFNTAKDIFEYLDNLGFFLDDADGRTKCIHEMEQL